MEHDLFTEDVLNGCSIDIVGYKKALTCFEQLRYLVCWMYNDLLIRDVLSGYSFDLVNSKKATTVALSNFDNDDT